MLVYTTAMAPIAREPTSSHARLRLSIRPLDNAQSDARPAAAATSPDRDRPTTRAADIKPMAVVSHIAVLSKASAIPSPERDVRE